MITKKNVMNWETFQSRVQNLVSRDVQTYRFRNLLARPNMVLSGQQRLVVVIEAFDSLDQCAPSRFDTDHAILSTYVTVRALYRLPQRISVSAILSKGLLRCPVEVGYREIGHKAKAILDNRKPVQPTPVAALLCGQLNPQLPGGHWSTPIEEVANVSGLLQPALAGPPGNADTDSGGLTQKA